MAGGGGGLFPIVKNSLLFETEITLIFARILHVKKEKYVDCALSKITIAILLNLLAFHCTLPSNFQFFVSHLFYSVKATRM